MSAVSQLCIGRVRHPCIRRFLMSEAPLYSVSEVPLFRPGTNLSVRSTAVCFSFSVNCRLPFGRELHERIVLIASQREKGALRASERQRARERKRDRESARQRERGRERERERESPPRNPPRPPRTQAREFIGYKTSVITDEDPPRGCCSTRISVSLTQYTFLQKGTPGCGRRSCAGRRWLMVNRS